jgi:hypothetical protein
MADALVYLGQYAAADADSFIEPSGPRIGGLAKAVALGGTICVLAYRHVKL